MTRSYKYFIPALLLFLLEIFIARYMHDALIRPYGGDFLAVLLLYCFIKCFVNIPVFKTALWVLLIAYAIELSQYLHVTRLLGLQHSKLVALLLGTSFSWTDMLCYTCGLVFILIAEHFSGRYVQNNNNLKHQEL